MRTQKQLQLPLDFAQQLLRTQIKVTLNKQPRQRHISQLLQLYSYGFEYYESIGSYKHEYFHIKMKQIIRAHDQFINLKRQEEESEEITRDKSQTLMSIEGGLKIGRVRYLKQVEQQSLENVNSFRIEELLTEVEKKMVDHNVRVKYEIMFQEKWLQKKLQIRSRKRREDMGQKKILSQNETKSSLQSQPSKVREYTQGNNSLIFEDLIAQEEQYEMFASHSNKNNNPDGVEVLNM